MKNVRATARPPIHMIDEEADALGDLAISVGKRLPHIGQLLLEEVSRAQISSAEALPAGVVTMNAFVEFKDEASDTVRAVQLVFPRDADIANGRISILTPIGAGLIGLSQGQSILWPDRDGNERKLTIVKVNQAATTA